MTTGRINQVAIFPRAGRSTRAPAGGTHALSPQPRLNATSVSPRESVANQNWWDSHHRLPALGREPTARAQIAAMLHSPWAHNLRLPHRALARPRHTRSSSRRRAVVRHHPTAPGTADARPCVAHSAHPLLSERTKRHHCSLLVTMHQRETVQTPPHRCTPQA
jgi:hypothetical protein